MALAKLPVLLAFLTAAVAANEIVLAKTTALTLWTPPTKVATEEAPLQCPLEEAPLQCPLDGFNFNSTLPKPSLFVVENLTLAPIVPLYPWAVVSSNNKTLDMTPIRKVKPITRFNKQIRGRSVNPWISSYVCYAFIFIVVAVYIANFVDEMMELLDEEVEVIMVRTTSRRSRTSPRKPSTAFRRSLSPIPEACSDC
ncbi:unnamed protein product [Caenorhabditis auriculariae]|uniref:Uncharacterized protein n=1 Tax=Caenorhabditis auriculariae TaxID=2777116 RepID=A0A8S1GSQ4_9PELO|nr:unnamed protein product [Caenorhabditis auriculariae]